MSKPIMIAIQANIERNKELAKVIASIAEDPYFHEITGGKGNPDPPTRPTGKTGKTRKKLKGRTK